MPKSFPARAAAGFQKPPVLLSLVPEQQPHGPRLLRFRSHAGGGVSSARAVAAVLRPERKPSQRRLARSQPRECGSGLGPRLSGGSPRGGVLVLVVAPQPEDLLAFFVAPHRRTVE